MTTAIACEKHHIIWIINALGSFRRAHRHEMAASCWVVLVHLCHSEAIVSHASLLIVAGTSLLERCILLGSLCSIHSRLCVLSGPLSRIVLSLLFTETTTIFLIIRADWIRRCGFVKVSVRDLLPDMIIVSVQ